MAGLLGTALSGLKASQLSLETVGHNISNVNTDGYSRQRVELAANTPRYTGGGYVGQGVNVSTVARSYDRYLNQQLTISTSAYAEADTLATLALQADNVLSGESTSLSPALATFFTSVNEVANDPSSLPLRQVMLGEAQAISLRFTTVAGQLNDFRNQANNQMSQMLSDINAYAEGIADLNAKIIASSSRLPGAPVPNDLLDQRDELINKMAEKVSVSTLPQADGSVSVFIGNGQTLVLGNKTATLTLTGADQDVDHKLILLDGQDISSQISGGELSGALKFRDEILDPAQQRIGLLAAGFAVEFNALHQAGFDLNGDAGQAFFAIPAPAVIAEQGAVNAITASYDVASLSQLAASDYQLNYDGSQFALKRLSDNTVSTFAGPPPQTIAGPGFTLNVTAAITANSPYLIRPTYNAAQQLAPLLTDPRTIAAAGSADTVPGDNSTALNLARLENQALLLGGNATFNDINGQVIAEVGTLTGTAKTSSAAQLALLNQARQTRENLSGVNLDEEAANMVKFQQSYQAAAQAISVASSIFDTLLGAIR